ncbi:MFS transporter [Winogradskyella sp. PE311]|uniref:MFS transporter n=1 Tax=Winogradskyella sp. PE311 TaxID=3366943 RepID=UPI0039806CD4
MKSPKLILFIIVLAQFFCTSLWFASNSIIEELIIFFSLSVNGLGHLTIAIQFGFIVGTILFTALTIADRFSPSKVFFISAIFGAIFNMLIILDINTLSSLLLFRFSTGFFLAGIYPVGMKIAADYFDNDLGKSLGYLVGALVLGTAFPHFLKSIPYDYSWHTIIFITTGLAVLGGLLIFIFVNDGPNRKKNNGLSPFAFAKLFKDRTFRLFAFGYFGHMWELYAFWVFVPVILKDYFFSVNLNINISSIAFFIIASGSIACVIGGYLSQRFGLKRIAFISLILSCLCCLASPFIINQNSIILFISFFVFWGMVVIADSPLFSSLIAKSATKNIQGTALTIVNCIGYTITILSIEMVNFLYQTYNSNYIYLILAFGPILGLLALYKVRNDSVVKA